MLTLYVAGTRLNNLHDVAILILQVNRFKRTLRYLTMKDIQKVNSAVPNFQVRTFSV